MKMSFISLFVVLFSTCFSENAQSETMVANAVNYNWDLQLSGSIDGYTDGQHNNSRIAIDFNWSEPSMQYSEFAMTLSGTTTTVSKNFTTGPGQSKTIITKITWMPMSVYGSDFHKSALTPTQNGDYSVSGYPYFHASDITLAGTYDISGPTETVTGSFSINMPTSINGWIYVLHTQDYPLAIQVQGEPCFLAYWSVPNLINQTVDGVPININCYSDLVVNSLTLTVPEPSTFILLGMGAIGLIGFAWRRLRS
jgi:hypothetical protein